MDDQAKVTGTEEIVATPQQQKQALEDKTYYGDPVAMRIAAYEPKNNKEAVNTDFRRDNNWREFLADQNRNIVENYGKDYRTYRQLEKMWRQPEFASIIDAHGSEMTKGGQLLSDFVDWDKVSWWDKQVAGISAARYGMRIGEARTRVAQLEHEGADQAVIDGAKQQVAELEEYARNNTRNYDSDTANALASFGVSAARIVPDIVITSLALGAAIPSGGATAALVEGNAARIAVGLGNMFTKGTRAANIIRGLKAGRAAAKAGKYISAGAELTKGLAQGGASAAYVFNDTYRVTMGDLYERIKAENPGLSDEQAYDLADTSAELQATMEALPALVGLGRTAAITTELDVAIKSVLSKVPKDTLRRAAFMRAFQQGANKEIMKRIASGWTKDAITDTLTEVMQQASENATLEIAKMGGDAGEVVPDSLMRMFDFVLDPMNEKYADELNTLVSTLPAAVVFGGIGPGIAAIGHGMSKNSVGEKISDTFNNYRFGAQLRSFTQGQIDKVGAATLREQIEGMASRGDAPSSVYFDKNAVKELADTDPEFRNAMDRLGVLKKLDESEGNGGVVEVSLADYNEVVNGEKSGTLYQKVKDMVAFRLDSMTMSQLNEWIKSTEIQNKKEIQKAMEDQKSVYNRTLTEFLNDPQFAAMTEDQKKANATLMQLVANRASQTLAEPMTAEEWFEKNVLLVRGEREGYSASTLKQPVPSKVIPKGQWKENTIGGKRNYETPHITVLEQSDVSDLSMPTVIEFYVPENMRGQGLGKKLLKQAIDKYGNLSAQVSSKKAAKIFYELGGRLDSNVNATLEDIYKVMDEQTSAFMTKTLNNENARLDDIYPAYDGETISIDGKERTVYNSNGDRIAKSKEALTNFWRWFGDSKVVDEQGRPLVVYHGSTKKFEIFDINKSNKESNLGAGFYFTNNINDLRSNYEGGGADFDNRVDRIAEQIEQDEGISWEEAKAKAFEQEFEGDFRYEAYLKMENPFIIGGNQETEFTFIENYNEETEDYDEPTGTLLDFAYALDNELADLGIDKQVSQDLFERAMENGGVITASEIDKLLSLNTDIADSLIDYANESTGQLLSDAAGQTFDGFIDNTVNKKFGYERERGQAMHGLDENTTHYIVFNSNQIKSVENRGTYSSDTGNIYYQIEEDRVAGWFGVIDGKYVIGLTDNWNATTFSHEVFHLYSRVLQDNYNSGVMSSYWKAQTEKLFKTVDAKPNKKGQYKLTRNQEELLAERFTTYLLMNEIQNPELNSIFALLRAAFRETYATTDMTLHLPDAKTKEAFAVIFGAYDVALAEQQALGLVEIPKPEGVSQEMYDHYMSFLLEARAKATHDMIKTYYRVEKYKRSKEYAKAYDEVYTDNVKAIEKESTFQIKALAKQLNTTDIQAILLAYNSTHGDALITEDDVVAALNSTEEAAQVAEARTAETMNERIKEKFNIQDDQTLVSKDARNVAMAKAFLAESLMAEGKDWSEFEAEYTKLLNNVENQIQKMPLSKLQNSRRWNQLETVYAQQYQMYASLGDKAKVAAVRRQQAQVVLIQNKMFEMNNRVERFLEKFPKKLRNAQPQGQDVMSAESWDLLQSLMEQYGFKISDRRRGLEAFNVKLDNWLKNIEESEYCPISNIRYFMPETAQGHKGTFGSMTVRQFEVLEHMATAINSVASREYFLVTEAEKAEYAMLAAETAKRLQEKGIKPYDQNDTWVRKHLGVLSNIVNPEPILKALFPEEVHRLLIRPFFSAAAKAETDYNNWNDRWNQMIQKVNLSNNKKQYSTGHTLSYNNVANLLLAMGNEHSYENWRLFLHLDEAQAEAIVAEALAEQPALAEFANKYWAMMAETTEIMNDSYRQRYNKLFVKKQARAFKIGQYEFTGGYVPETKLVSELPEDAGWESIVMGELSNEKLLSDKPDGQDLQSIVDHTRNRLRLFARWGHVAPAFNNFVKFVQREDVGNAIGSRAQQYIRGWLRDYHTPATDSAGLMHALMSATTTTVLGIRLPQALLQLSGIIPAMGLIGRGGIRYMTSALGRTLLAGGFHQVKYAQTGKSAYMKARYADPVKTLFGVSKAEMQINKTLGKFQKLAMSWISYMDAIVANATWEASYRMALDNGMSEVDAIEKADQNVRLSQTDAMTVSRARAMKSDWARIITPFSTYMMGMQSVVRGRIAEKDFYGAMSFAMAYITISTMFEAMLKEMPMPWEPEDDENYVEKVIKRWYNDTVSTAGTALYPIAGLGSYTTESFAQAVEKLLNPDEPTLIDMYGMGSLSALNYAKQFPDAFRYGLLGIFNGDEDAQRKAIANFVGWFNAGGKRMVKDLMED